MSYTVWLDGNKIGETNLELRHGGRRRAGIFHPTELGLSVLPGITAMGPALLDIGRMCRGNGALTDPDDPEFDAETEKVFETPEGRRMLAAAKEISRLELRDPSGKTVAWESLLISDFPELVNVARGTPDDPPPENLAIEGEPVRYLLSTTLRKEGGVGRRTAPRARLRS